MKRILFGLLLCSAAANAKYAVLDVMQLVSNTQEGKAARTKLESDFKQKQTILNQKQNELKKLQEDFEKQAPLMTPDARAKKGAEFQGKYMELQKTFGEMQQQMAQQEQTLLADFMKKLEPVAKDYATKNGFDGILTKQACVFCKEEDDKTAEITKLYDATHTKAKTPKKAGKK